MLVFRQTVGGTVIQSMPRKSDKVSEAQRRKFQRAILYSQFVATNGELEASYAAKAKAGRTARNVAVADFMYAPGITVPLSW
jgi:hypothetical protein